MPVSRAFANSKAATAELAGPSHISAASGSTRTTRRLGLSGPLHQIFLLLVPECLCAVRTVGDESLAGYGEVHLLLEIGESEADLRIGVDLVVLEPAMVGQKPPSSRSGCASIGRAPMPPSKRVVIMQTPAFSMTAQTLSTCAWLPIPP